VTGSDPSVVAAAASDAKSALAGLLAPPQAAQAGTPGAQLVVDTLQQAGQQGVAQIVAAAGQTIQSIQDTAIDQSTTIDQTATDQAAALHTTMAQSQTQIQDAVTTNTGTLQASATGAQARLTDWNTQAVARAQEEVATRQDELQSAGEEQAQQAQAAGTNASGAAIGALNTASSEARQSAGSGGGGATADAQQAHAEVANKLSTDTASQIDSASGQVDEQFRAHAADAAGAVQTHAAQMATAVGSTLPTLTGGIGETAAGASEEVGKAATTAQTTLAEHGQRAVDELGTTESRLTTEMGTQAQESRDQLHSSATQAVEGISNQATQAVGDAQAKLADQASQIQGAHVDEGVAAGVATHVQTEVGSGFTAASGEIADTEGQITGQLQGAGGSVVTALESRPSQAQGALASATDAVTGDMAGAAAQLGSGLTQAVDATSKAGDAAISDAGGALDGLVATGRDALSGAVSAVSAGLDQEATATAGRAQGATTGLQQSIAEGGRRVDEVAANESQQTDVQRSFWGAVGNWFAEQFSDLGHMLSSPSFWVGLGVTLILLPVLGPGALVVGGIAAGATSGIEQNVKEGKAWYDFHNIIKGAAIGALGGALFALGAVLILALGLEGLAALGATMLLSAVVGIIINLVTGQRWDKNLLANLLLAWLFHELGGGFVEEPEVVPEGGETPTGPKGGESDPNAPGPKPNEPGGEQPSDEPGGSCFVAGTLVDTRDGLVPIETIMPGVTVIGWDTEAGCPVDALVSTVMRRDVATVLDLHISGGIVSCSPEHPFWVPGSGWLTAGTLTVGTTLFTRDGTPATIGRIDRHEGGFTVFNMMVDGPHDYFVGPSRVLVHNKAMRWALQDRIASLQQQSASAVARVDALPESTPGRAQLLEQAQAIRTEATDLANRAQNAPDEAALEPERPAVEGLEERLGKLDEALEIPEIPSRTAELERGVNELLERAQKNLPEELPNRWDIIGRTRGLQHEVADLRALVDEGLADQSVVDEIDRLNGELRDLDGEVTENEPAAPATDVWQERLDKATWAGYDKHMQARTAAEAREMSTPTDQDPNPASQYLPDLDVQALELEALRNGQVIRGDPNDPNSGVHVKYDAGRVIGYDGGEPVSTMRAELSGGAYHGHPRKF
jgi:hypothetical protein